MVLQTPVGRTQLENAENFGKVWKTILSRSPPSQSLCQWRHKGVSRPNWGGVAADFHDPQLENHTSDRLRVGGILLVTNSSIDCESFTSGLSSHLICSLLTEAFYNPRSLPFFSTKPCWTKLSQRPWRPSGTASVDGASIVRRRSVWLTCFSCIWGHAYYKKALISLTIFETKNEMRMHIRFARTCNIFRVRGVIMRMPYLPSWKVCWPNSISFRFEHDIVSISPNSRPIAIKFGRVVVHTHKLTSTSEQMIMQQIKKKIRKTARKNLIFLFAQIFCHHCIPGSGDSQKHFFSGGGPEIYQVHEPQTTLIVRHYKELIILKELRLRSQKRTNHTVPGFCNILTSEAQSLRFMNLAKSHRVEIYVAPYSRPVPNSRHPPYSRHFFNDTHENDCVWALFPIAVSGDHFSTQVCKEILSILSIFFGEAS